MRSRWIALTMLAAALGGPVAAARASGVEEGPIPPYVAAEADGADARAVAVADAAIAEIVAQTTPALRARAVRRLTAAGPSVAGRVAAALRTAGWRGRAGLVAALAEMDAPQITPLLVQASADPSFAVREAAVTGLGKTGDVRGAAALAARARAADEPSWRVRVAAAEAMRRAVLRGSMERTAAGAALAPMLGDDDPDVARAAIEATAPLALPETLAPLLARFTDLASAADLREESLRALRAYRDAAPELVPALRRGFLGSAAQDLAVRAGRALLDVSGVAALDDPEIADAVLRQLSEGMQAEMREAIVALGRGALPWVEAHARSEALRAASARHTVGEPAFEPLLDAAFQLDEAAGLELLRWVLVGPDTEVLPAEVRRLALQKAQYGFAPKLAAELRAHLASKIGAELYEDAFAAVVASGGDDIGALVESGLHHASRNVRARAVDVLNSDRTIPTPAALVELAKSSQHVRERTRALSCLGRRDPAVAAQIARDLLSHPDPELRTAAVIEIGAAKDATAVELLRRRLAEEEGVSSVASGTGPETPPPAAVTASDESDARSRVRRNVRSAIVRALADVAGEASAPDVRRALSGEPDAKVRETAAQTLRSAKLLRDDDAPMLAARIAAETDDDVRTEVERCLATLAGAPEARAHFAARLRDERGRRPALALLREAGARVVPEGLEASLSDASWSDDERASALAILERDGRVPSAAALARLVRGAHSLELVTEATRLLGADESPDAARELARLLDEETDLARRALAVRGLGMRGATTSVPVVAALAEETRAAALAADSAAAPVAELHRQCITALGRIGTEDAVRALVSFLLHPDLADAAALRSVMKSGPFQPAEGAVVSVVRALCAAVALTGDDDLAPLVEAELARRAATADDAALDPEYADGIARYLADPLSYGLPARPRSATALPLWKLAALRGPRWRMLGAEAWRNVAAELESQGRCAEALDAYRAAIAIHDVEDAARPREDRTYESGRSGHLAARAAAAAGRADDALALARGLRASDPSNPDLALLTGICLVRIGRSDDETEKALREALARDSQEPRALFYLAWVVSARRGAAESVPLWAAAERMDARRVTMSDRAESERKRRGVPHVSGWYAYMHARALAAAGRGADAAPRLADAVETDDRFAGLAARDAAFASVPSRDDVVAAALSRIRDDP